MTGHGISPQSNVLVDLPVRDAVVKGRSRAAPFHKQVAGEAQPPPGALVYMDFAGPLIESVLHRFACYCGTVDAGSGYGRVWPDRNMTAPVASSALAKFVADVASKMSFNELYKPAVVRSDKGSAFIAYHFREFLADRQIHLTYSAEYTPQQNSHILLASAAMLSRLPMLTTTLRSLTLLTVVKTTLRHLPVLLSLHLRSLPTPTLMLFCLSYRLRLRRLDVPEG
jgi:transposase InsO family protein